MADFQTNFQCKSGQMVSIAVHDFGPRVTVSDWITAPRVQFDSP